MAKFDKNGNPIKQSRWVKSSDVPRYTKEQQAAIAELFHEADGWHRGARVYRA